MKIFLNVDELLFDMRNKSHQETADITDVEERYRVEAGEHKVDELRRGISEVASILTRTVSRYLVDYYHQYADNDSCLPETLVYEFELSERRMINKAQPLSDAMHSFIVHYVLAKYYATVNRTELSNKHSQLTQEAALLIDEILYTKRPPIV